MSRRNATRNASRQAGQRIANPQSQPNPAPPTVNMLGINYLQQEHLAKHPNVVNRRMRPTKFYDEDVAKKLGVENDVKQLFYAMGVPTWLNMHALTYKRLTVEFFSSLCVHRSNCDDPRFLTFQLMNQEQRMTVDQVNRCFQWPLGKKFGPKDRSPSAYEPGSFWRRLTGLFVRNPRSDKATAIIHPAFRLTQRLLANTIFARGDSSGVVSNRELRFLWHFTEGDDRLDFGEWLMDHLDDVAKGSGGIAIGGMITLIAIFLGVDFTGLQPLPGATRLDMASLKNMGWVTSDDE